MSINPCSMIHLYDSKHLYAEICCLFIIHIFEYLSTVGVSVSKSFLSLMLKCLFNLPYFLPDLVVSYSFLILKYSNPFKLIVQ